MVFGPLREQWSIDAIWSITGMDEQSIRVEATAFFNASAGWQTIVKHDPVPSAPLGRYIFVKPMPQPGCRTTGSWRPSRISVPRLGRQMAAARNQYCSGNISNAAGSIKREDRPSSAKPGQAVTISFRCRGSWKTDCPQNHQGRVQSARSALNACGGKQPET